jgi:NO-binding membrane sensor protein with MHYT domain
MPVTHEPWLVVLSVLVAVQGSYVGLSLAVQVSEAVGGRRRVLLAGASISLAVAIWAMHFVAMLAARLPFPVDYLVFPTLLSFLVCVIVVGAAVLAVSVEPLTNKRLFASAVFMGAGIVSMHYIGMTALHASAHMTHQPLLVAASVVIAIVASGLALRLAAGRGRGPLVVSAIALGLAISGMHYTAMAGLTLFPHANPPSTAPALSTDLLAIVVAVVAFMVSGAFLLILVPDRNARQRAALPTVGGETPIEVSPPLSEIGAATIAANGAGLAPAALVSLGGPPHQLARSLPVEKEGLTHFVPVEDIVAVHANAHYTYVFDGTSKFFCQLAIGEVETRLDPGRFMRVHRSHIVNVDRITGLKLGGDNGLVELAAEGRYTVPVSRGRFGEVKARLGLVARAAFG